VEILVGVAVAVALGVGWALVLRRSGRRRRLAGAPKDVDRLLAAYRRSDWATVADGAPDVLGRPSDGADQAWRPALELALGQSLVELDRPDEAIAHLERGLLLQVAVRRAHTGGDRPDPGEAKLRHLLGWAYAATGRSAQARREYRRLLAQPDLDPDVRRRVEASLAALDS
jgi:Flp pilus assembly protein TadD